MYTNKNEKTLSIGNGETIVIRRIINPITEEPSFLIINEQGGYNAIITRDIVIDGVKLVFA